MSLCESKSLDTRLPEGLKYNCHLAVLLNTNTVYDKLYQVMTCIKCLLSQRSVETEQPLNETLPQFLPLIVVRNQAKHDGCTQITEGFALLLHAVKSPELRCNKNEPLLPFSRVSRPHRGAPLQSRTSSPEQQIALSPGFARNPPSRAALLPPASRSRQVLQAARPGPQITPRPSLARPAPSLASPPPGAWAQAQGPRDLRSRGPTARCCASHPGRGFGPGPLTHPTIARPKSWCFLRAAAPTSPSTHRRKGPATRSPEPPLGPLSSRKASSKEEPIRQNGRRPGTFPACRAPAETRLGPGGEGGATPPARGRDLRARPRASGGQALTPPRRVCARRALASLTACAVGPFHFEKKAS